MGKKADDEKRTADRTQTALARIEDEVCFAM